MEEKFVFECRIREIEDGRRKMSIEVAQEYYEKIPAAKIVYENENEEVKFYRPVMYLKEKGSKIKSITITFDWIF